MIYVDTGAWYALMVPSHPNHDSAVKSHKAHQHECITTDYIVDEILTLLRSRGYNSRALIVGHQLLNVQTLAALHMTSDTEFMAAWDTFREYADKQWNFTDCLSFVTMKRLKIATAFTFDHHFRQFGSITVAP